MAATWGTARCLACGHPIAALVPATPGARWFPCPNCGAAVAVVPPTSPPPIFSWEVFPLVYPPPPPVRLPGRRTARLAAIALVGSVLLLAGVAGALAYSGAVALGPSTFRLAGSVTDLAGGPVAGATLRLASETGWTSAAVTGADGAYAFAAIPAGGATLNVTAPGFARLSVALFFSPTYRATGAGAHGLVLTLHPGAPGNTTTVEEGPYLDLESFVASQWSASALLALAAFVAGAGAVVARRGRRPALGVAGGLAAAVGPVALSLLGVTTAFPLAWAPVAACVGLGAVGAGFELAALVAEGRAAGPD